MSASLSGFTVVTVNGSFSETSTFGPSRVLTVSVWPFRAAMVPRIRVGGAVCAIATDAKRQPVSASVIRRANTLFTPCTVTLPMKHRNELPFGKGWAERINSARDGLAIARQRKPAYVTATGESVHGRQEVRCGDLPQPCLL